MEIEKREVETVACDFCGKSECSTYILPASYPSEMPERPKVVECKSCGQLYTPPRPKRDFLTWLYQKYYPQKKVTGETLRTALVRNRLIRRLWHWYCGQYLSEVLRTARGRVLDIGCGTGDLLAELEQNGCEGFGVELNPDSVAQCLKRGLKVKCGDLEDFHFGENFFDGIMLWHVIEHVPSPGRLLDNCLRMLKPGGSVFIYSPNARSYLAFLFKEYWFAWHLPFHFTHFTRESISGYARKHGLLVKKLSAVTVEFNFSYSLNLYCNLAGGPLMKYLSRKRFFNNVPFRMVIAPVFRLLDTVFSGKGEYLQVRLEKPA